MSTSSIHADEYVIGLAYDDVFGRHNTRAPAAVFEYHADPFFSGVRASYSFAVAGQADGDGDVFLGVGVYALWTLGRRPWFVEGSFMPGYYDEGSNGTPLGGKLQFRTLLGVGYQLSDTTRVSLAIDHKSNAGLEDSNPGSETLAVRYTRGF